MDECCTDIIEVTGNFLKECDNNAMRDAWTKTQNAIAKMEHINEAWCRSKTRWSLEHITINSSGRHPWKQMRSISAQLENRRLALSEAKWNIIKLQVDIDEARHKLVSENDDFKRKRLLIEIGEKEERISLTLTKFHGAMKVIADLEVLYDELVPVIGDINDNAINDSEPTAHIHRAISQSIRSIRQSGIIDTGNQEYLEQCGINPTFARTVIVEFLDSNANKNDLSLCEIEKFIREFIGIVDIRGRKV